MSLSRSLEKARAAYAARDVEATKKAHQPQAEEVHRAIHGQYIKSAVYGGVDGIITTFAVVAGVAGASLSSGIVLILGFANLLADGLSMAIGDFLSTRSEQEYEAAERVREEWEVDNYPDGEKREMMELYMEKGLEESEARSVVDILSRKKKVWVDVMMVEELGIVSDTESPLKNAIVTFCSFCLFGVVPLLAFLASRIVPELSPYSFMLAIVLTAVTLFVVGAAKVLITGRNAFKSGAEMLIVGGIASGAAYLVGVLLSGFAPGG